MAKECNVSKEQLVKQFVKLLDKMSESEFDMFIRGYIWRSDDEMLGGELDNFIKPNVTNVDVDFENMRFEIEVDSNIQVDFDEMSEETLQRWITAIEHHDY